MDPITCARDVVLLLHLVGFAALLGGQLVQLRDPEPLVNGAMAVGAPTQLLTGLALVGLDLGVGAEVDYPPLAVKLAITAVVTLLVLVNRRFDSIPRGLWALLTLLTLATAAITVFW